MPQFDENNNYTQFEQPAEPVTPITPPEDASPKTVTEFLAAALKRTAVKIGLIVAAVAVAVLVFLLFMPKQDPVQEDLLDYINNDLPTIIDLESSTVDLYDEAKDDTANDYEMFVMLRDKVIPAAKKWKEETANVDVETDEVRAVHEIYIQLVNENYNGMTMMLAALEKQDYVLITQANEKLQAAEALSREYQASLNSLMNEHDVVFEE